MALTWNNKTIKIDRQAILEIRAQIDNIYNGLSCSSDNAGEKSTQNSVNNGSDKRSTNTSCYGYQYETCSSWDSGDKYNHFTGNNSSAETGYDATVNSGDDASFKCKRDRAEYECSIQSTDIEDGLVCEADNSTLYSIL